MKPRINLLPKNKIPLFTPYLTSDELAAVSRVIRNGWLTLGQEAKRFEQEFAECVGARYAVAVNSGTAALHLAVIASGIKPGDEVITTPFTFIASTNCFLYEKAKPVFVDIDPDTFNINANEIEAKITKKTKAILAVDVFGYPAEWEKIKKIALKHKLAVIEDAAEALGAKYQNKLLGSLGHQTIFSFFPNKQITTGEGGAIVTNSRQNYLLLKSLANQGKITNRPRSPHNRLGYNYRLPELAAAMGQAQLKKIDVLLANRRQIAGWYYQQLRGVAGIYLPLPDDINHRRSWFVFTVRVDNKINRDAVAANLARRGVPVKTYFPSIHLQPFLKRFGYKLGDLPVSEAISRSTLSLPFYTGMKQAQVIFVCQQIKKVL